MALPFVRRASRLRPGVFLVPGDRPTLGRQDDETGLVETPLDQAGGDDVSDNLLELAALDTRARSYGADTPPCRRIAAADIIERRHKLCRECQAVKLRHRRQHNEGTNRGVCTSTAGLLGLPVRASAG
jgi:hypothetical protein